MRILTLFRSNDGKMVFSNIINSVIVRGIALAVSMYMMNAYLTYFDSEEYLGIWLTVVSILTWILTFDLGIGNGLRNHLANALAHNDMEKAKELVSSAVFVLAAISILGFVISSGIVFIFDWNQVLNISVDRIGTDVLREILWVSFGTVFLRFFLNIVTAILYALQKTWVNNLIALVTNILLLFYLLCFTPINDLDGLRSLTYAYFFLANAPLLIGLILLFVTSLKMCKPNFHWITRDASRNIIKLGGVFFVVQIELMLLNATNEFVLTSVYGASTVTVYQIYYKVFNVAAILFSIVCQPIWSAITKAAGERQFDYIHAYTRMMYIVASIGTAFCVVGSCIFQRIINIWLGDNAIQVTTATALCFALYTGATMFMNAGTCVANGLGNAKLQMNYYVFALVIRFGYIFGIAKQNKMPWETIILLNGVLLLGIAILQGVQNQFMLKKIQTSYT